MSKTAVETLLGDLGLFDSLEEFKHSLRANQAATPQSLRRVPGGGKSSRSKGSARGAISRVVRKAPEVMVKVSGSGKASQQVWGHLTYITRNGKIEAENESGETLTGLDEVKELHEAWSELVGKRRANGNITLNVLFSMPVGTNPELLKEAVREFGRDRFANHEYLFVLHTPETDPDPDAPDHPHVHMCVKVRGLNGKRLAHRKKDLQEWRELFAEKLREKGIEAAATPRSVRGVVRKGLKQPVYQAAKKQRSTVKESMVKEAAEAVLNGRESKPWEPRITEKQTAIRGGWLTLADVLDRTGAQNDRLLSGQIREFVKGMPAPITERQAIENEMRRLVKARAEVPTVRQDVVPPSKPQGPER